LQAIAENYSSPCTVDLARVELANTILRLAPVDGIPNKVVRSERLRRRRVVERLGPGSSLGPRQAETRF
jgi:hypothetical protein